VHPKAPQSLRRKIK